MFLSAGLCFVIAAGLALFTPYAKAAWVFVGFAGIIMGGLSALGI